MFFSWCCLGSVSVSSAFSLSMPVPAPAPAVNAWDKPIRLATVPVTVSTGDNLAFEKGDQHDSGVDLSEAHNSGTSSTRSSPSAEKKSKPEDVLSKVGCQPK